MTTQTTTTRAPQPERFDGEMAVLRSRHGDDGQGGCLMGCGPFPCHLRTWTDRVVEIRALCP